MRMSIILTVVGTIPLLAQVPETAKKDDVRASRLNLRVSRYQEDARDYQFFKSGMKPSDASQLRLVPNPLMTYSDPTPGGKTHHGAFFAWTYRGRPEIIASIWSMGLDDGEHRISHEFHSLSTAPLIPKVVGGRRWAPSKGIKVSPIPGAGTPSKSNRLRLGQMRSLAREFTGFTLPPRAAGNEWRLRTSSTPIYRYESEDPAVVDGAIFVMFAEWDPDMFLLIEARKSKGQVKWHYGQARLNRCPLRLEHKGEEVWKEDDVPFADSSANYFMVAGGRIPPLNSPPAQDEP